MLINNENYEEQLPTYDAHCLVVVTITVIKLRLAKCRLGTNSSDLESLAKFWFRTLEIRKTMAEKI